MRESEWARESSQGPVEGEPVPRVPTGWQSHVALAVVVAVGGSLGTALRYEVGQLLPTSEGAWPVATLLVNLTGAFALGFLLVRLRLLGREVWAVSLGESGQRSHGEQVATYCESSVEVSAADQQSIASVSEDAPPAMGGDLRVIAE